MNTVASRPADFDRYWDAVDSELRDLDGAAELESIPGSSTEAFTTYRLRLTSIGPYRIFGYLGVPTGDGPFPGLLQTPRYGSVNHIPDYNDRLRYVVLQIMHRGQRLADSPFAASYPGLLTEGIGSASTYIYRGIAADCLRAAEYLLGRPEIDRSRVGIVGDDLALITAARRPSFSAMLAEDLMFYRLDEARRRTDAYPIEEVNDYLRGSPNQAEQVGQTLAYFDPLYHATSIRAATLLSVGDAGGLNGPEWLAPLLSGLGARAERYQVTHYSGTDNDQKDAWLARKLGVEPMSRFRRTLE